MEHVAEELGTLVLWIYWLLKLLLEYNIMTLNSHGKFGVLL